jgi:hypothetical protein
LQVSLGHGYLMMMGDELHIKYSNNSMINLNVVLHCNFSLIYNLRILWDHEKNTKLNFECQKHNTMIVLLKTNNLSLCLNREYFKFVLQKNILK